MTYLPYILGLAIAFCVGVVTAFVCLKTDHDRTAAASAAFVLSFSLLLILVGILLAP